ncbi:MAG: hypothetical protein M3Y42_12230 [Actinomycetota bacterium]|nr:hypothetical protein [Actinomycetota bacterium]
MPSSVDLAIQRIGAVFTDVADTLSRPDGPGELLGLLGWTLPPGVEDIGLAALDLSDLVTAIESLDVAVTAGTTGVQLDANYAQVALEVAHFVQGVDAVVSGFSALGDYLVTTDILHQFVPRLLDFAVVEALNVTSSLPVTITTFLGITETVPFPADPTVYQAQHLRRIVRWDRIPRIFGDLRGLLSEIYQWGTANANPEGLVIALGTIVSSLSAVVRVRALPRRAEAALVGHDVPEADADPMTQVLLSIAKALDWSGTDVGVSLISLRATTPGGTDAGLALAPYVFGSTDQSFPITDRLSFGVDATLDIDSGIALTFRPGTGITLIDNLTAGGAANTTSGHLLATFTLKNADASPLQLLTVLDGLGLQAGSLAISAGADVSSGQLSAIASVALKQGVFRVDTAHLDSFLASIIPVNIAVNFDLTFGWSSAHGLFIEGNASPHFDIGVNTDLGPFHIQTLHLALTLGQPDLPLELSLDGSGTLGPLQIAVQRLGVTADVKFQHGNLGPVDLQLGFKPPTGLGIQLDAGLAAGGGFISFDPANGRYAGVLDVTIADIIAVKVIAVLDTKLPDGSDGFSFLMIITFEFPPIQLGLGFTLNGVGGLGGVNRTMVIDALQAGLRAHTLDDILFPPDPVANATKIISDIESFFPPQEGRYLFGPMLSIGWGTPTLLELEVGVILEVPDPIRLAILGEIKASIPSPDFPLISLKIQVLGTIDFGLQKLAIDGTMYDSYLLAFQLGGDMALRLNWGDSPDFLFSLGGFNPHFTPPPDVPALARLSISLGSGDNPRLAATAYLAVTSNSLQFGANVDAYAAAGGFAVHGYIGFDALFIFSPFSFEFDFSAGFDISYDGATLAGITLNASLSGPTPWHLHGDASLTFLFFSVSASIDLTWGDSNQATLPPAAVIPALTGALGDPRNWSVALPAGAPAVSLRSIVADPTVIVVQPTGVLAVREIVVPLDVPITKFVNAQPTDGHQFGITDVRLNSQPTTATPQREDFAPAQFTDLTDADKVSSQSYELFDAGVRIGDVPLRNGADAPRTIQYVTKIIDDYQQTSRLAGLYLMPAHVHNALIGTRKPAATASTGLRGFATRAPDPVAVQRPAFVIASTLDLTERSDVLTGATTYYQARVALSSYLAVHPEQRDLIQVVAAHEAVSV